MTSRYQIGDNVQVAGIHGQGRITVVQNCAAWPEPQYMVWFNQNHNGHSGPYSESLIFTNAGANA